METIKEIKDHFQSETERFMDCWKHHFTCRNSYKKHDNVEGYFEQKKQFADHHTSPLIIEASKSVIYTEKERFPFCNVNIKYKGGWPRDKIYHPFLDTSIGIYIPKGFGFHDILLKGEMGSFFWGYAGGPEVTTRRLHTRQIGQIFRRKAAEKYAFQYATKIADTIAEVTGIEKQITTGIRK